MHLGEDLTVIPRTTGFAASVAELLAGTHAVHRSSQDYAKRIVVPVPEGEMSTERSLRSKKATGKAYDARDPTLIWIKTMPDFDPLRDAPRFHDLQRRMNFPK